MVHTLIQLSKKIHERVGIVKKSTIELIICNAYHYEILQYSTSLGKIQNKLTKTFAPYINKDYKFIAI